MSIPEFSGLPTNHTFEHSIIQILASIAMEEIALSHIINAEGEKLQYILGISPIGGPAIKPTVEDVLRVNESIMETLQAVSYTQMFLSSKMSDAFKAYMQYRKLKGNGGNGGGGNGGDGNGGDGGGPGPLSLPHPQQQ
ncbi:MAG: hypothetical protein FWG30_09760 [Eubacteriaceae bacterium]|nr:hypothetical protein [Eubacteriaceae bacterium]